MIRRFQLGITFTGDDSRCRIETQRFISRLMAYAAYHKRDALMAKEAWEDLFTRLEHTPMVQPRVFPFGKVNHTYHFVHYLKTTHNSH